MEQIRLTCGGCDKRYRLPGNAVGYFRCRKCDLVMAIPSVASHSSAASPPPSQTLASEQEFEVLDEDDIDEIVMDPSTNEPLHLTRGTSSSFSSEQFESTPEAYPSTYRQYRGHIKQQTSFSPADAATIFVGMFMVLGGWFTIILQLLKEGGDQSLSMIAVILGLLAAIAGTGMLAFGLRRNKMILLPAAVIGGAVSILLFGVAIAPTAEDPDQIVQIENEDDGLFEPKSEFDVERQRKKAEEREKKLSDVDKRLNSLERDREKRNRSEPTTPRKRTNKRSETPKKDKPGDEGSPFESTNQNPFASRDLNVQASASGANAREIERLWTSVQPGKRHEIMDDMQDVVEEGLDEADASERDYWEMFENRLNALKKFDDGKWVALDFEYGLTGWHVADMNSVAVESDEVVQIKPANEENERAILSSADMFYGPISLQAKLKVNGGRSSTPNLGLVFGSGQHDQTIAPEDCVVLFDPAFKKIRTGPFGAGTRPASLSDLSPPISIAKPVDLQVNICHGYLQVFANKQLLVEKFDPAIKDVHAVSLALLDDTSGSIRVNDWQVRRWKYGRPPGKQAFVEEELMYLEEAIKDFKDIGWYHYRLALARFGCKKFLKAAESARRAEQLGIPREKMAIIYALEQELQKNYSDAALLYTQMAPGAGQEIAKAWHAWFVLTHPDPGIHGLATSRSLSDDFYPDRWVVQRIKAAIAAKQGNYSLAAQMLGEVLREVPLKWRGDTRKQQQQYEIGQLYFRGRSRVPFYQLLKVRIQPDQVEYASAATD